MTITPEHAKPTWAAQSLCMLDELFDWLRGAAIAWLLLVGLWSGPALGATLVYRYNGLPAVEVACLIVLLYQAWRGRLRSPRTYPFLWPCLAVLALSAYSALMRLLCFGIPFDLLRLWQHGEPMARGLLLFLAIAGQPRLTRVAWIGLFSGITVLAASCIVQHCTEVTRWYADLDRGWATGFHPLRGPRTQGLTSYINLTAAMLAAALPCWLLPPLLHRKIDRRLCVLLIAGGVATGAALWYTDSRGPMVALAIAGSLLLWRISRRWGVYALLALFMFILAVWPASPLWALFAFASGFLLVYISKTRRWRMLLAVTLGSVFAGGLQVIDAYVLHLPLHWRVLDEGLSDHQRILLVHDAWHVVRLHPWYGVGEAGLDLRLLYAPHSFFDKLPLTQHNAHNQYLQWAATEGIPVALAFTLLFIWTIYWLLNRSAYWRDPFARALGLGAAIGLATFLLCCLVDAHFWRIEGGGFYWSVLATVTAIGEQRRLKPKPGPLSKLWAEVTAAAKRA